jgi:hypothetical protein
VSALDDLRVLKEEAAEPQLEITEALKRDPIFRAGYAYGFGNAVDDCIEITEEAEYESETS